MTAIITVLSTYCYLLQQYSTVIPLQPNVSMGLLFLFWLFLPSVAIRPSRFSVVPTARRQQTLAPHANGQRRDSDMR